MAINTLDKFKKFQLYKRLTESNLLDLITEDNFKKHGMTKDEVILDVENNYSGLIEPKFETYEDEGPIADTNKPATNFEWTTKNMPLIEPEYYVYDNTSGVRFEILKKVNSYPKVQNNISSTCKVGNDDFTTYNNKQFVKYFEHVQGLIRPLEDKTLDAWYDVGVNAVMYQGGIPYTAPNFQKTFYVWYIKGDGTDYPYLGQVGYIYPGQEYNFAYRYQSIKRCNIKAATVLNVKGTSPIFRWGKAQEGFFVKLNEANQYTHSIAKVNLDKLSTLGQRWHYQGFTVKSFPVFSKKLNAIKLNMEGDETTLDITDRIETSLTWEFEEFSITSNDPDICRVEHDWVKDPTNPTYIVGPSYIKLIGNGDIDTGKTVITVKARPVGSEYVETFSFTVDIEQLYKGTTYLNIYPNPMVVKVGETLDYTVDTNAATYNVSSNVTGLLRVYKGKITGVKIGKGILNFYAKASMSRPAELNIPFRVDRYVPPPKITTKSINLTIEAGKKASLSFETNCPRGFVQVEPDDFSMLKISNITWDKETKPDSDPLNKDYPISTGSIDIQGLKIGSTKLYINGYIVQGDEVIEITILINIVEPTVDPDEPIEDDNSDRLATIKDTDVYFSFHDQAQGQFTYLRSKARENNKAKNKIYVIPKPSEELLAAYPDKEFNLALVEDLTKEEEDQNDITTFARQNPNSLDWKEKGIPDVKFTGQPGDVEKESYVSTEMLELFQSKNTNVDHKHWVSRNGVMVGDIWYKHPGEKGFGVGPSPIEISTYYGLKPLPGCWDPNSNNYGNYEDIHGNIMVYVPRHYIAEEYNNNGKMLSVEVYYPVTMDYKNYDTVELSTNGTVVDSIIRNRYNNDTKLKKGTKEFDGIKNRLILPRCFVNNGKVLPGIFIDKYPNGGYTPTKGTNTYSKRDVPYFGVTLDANRLTPDNVNTGNVQPRGNDEAILSLFGSANRGGRELITESQDITHYNRRGSDMAFITPFVRNMLNRLAIAHGYGCNVYTTPENCAWLSSETGFINNVSNSMLTNINNVNDRELALGTHNGQVCGIFGLNTSMLEACIGVYQSLNVTVANNKVAGYNLSFTVATRNMDIRTLSKNYSNLYSTSTADTEKSLPSHISGKQPDNGNGYGLNEYAAKGFKNTCLMNNQVPLGALENIKDNVPASNVWDLYKSECYKYNLGYTGTFIQVPETSEVTSDNLNKNDYSNRLQLDTGLENINLGDHRIKYYTGIDDDYTAQDLANGNMVLNFFPLYGGVLENQMSYLCKSGTADNPAIATNMRYTILSNHAMSCTWYRLGYDFNSNRNKIKPKENVTEDMGDTHHYFVPVFTRRTILPDMDAIAEYVANGTYAREVRVLQSKSYNTFGSKLLTKENNDPWSE